MPDVSIVICTRNRIASLRDTLPTLAEAARRALVSCELIVVDNASTDNTSDAVRAWAATETLDCRVVQQPTGGLAAARNRGLSEARGEIVVFTDDDCRMDPDYLTIAARLFAADAGPVLRGGRIELGDPADLPFTIKTEAARSVFDGESHPGGFLHGCNMVMSRAVIETVGTFDERFGAGAPFKAAEDTDYLLRAHLAGIPVIYEPELVVHHHHGRRRREDILRLNRVYAIGNGALYAKHARHWKFARNFLWDVKGAVREQLGRGDPFDPVFGFTWRANVVGCLAGMASFARHAVGHARRPTR